SYQYRFPESLWSFEKVTNTDTLPSADMRQSRRLLFGERIFTKRLSMRDHTLGLACDESPDSGIISTPHICLGEAWAYCAQQLIDERRNLLY
ncbi:MAG: hypothetical protein ABSD79_04160, partial [Dehalococcoidales bacterium]